MQLCCQTWLIDRTFLFFLLRESFKAKLEIIKNHRDFMGKTRFLSNQKCFFVETNRRYDCKTAKPEICGLKNRTGWNLGVAREGPLIDAGGGVLLCGNNVRGSGVGSSAIHSQSISAVYWFGGSQLGPTQPFPI